MDALKKLMMKKQQEGHTLSPMERDAKLSVLQDLHKQMTDAMSGKLGGLKKVTVAADSDEDLAHGLDKAKEALHGHAMDDEDMSPEHDEEQGEDEESPEHELSESPEEELAEGHDEHSDDDDMSEEELNAQLEHLMALKKKKGLA